MLSMPRVGICHTFKWLLMNTQRTALPNFPLTEQQKDKQKELVGFREHISPKGTDRAHTWSWHIRGQTTAGGTFKPKSN